MFNLFKSAQISEAPAQLGEIVEQTEDQLAGEPIATSDELIDATTPEAEEAVANLVGVEFFTEFMTDLRQGYPDVASAVEAMPDYKELAVAVGQNNPSILREEVAKYEQQGVVPTALAAPDIELKQNMLMDRARSIARTMRDRQDQQNAMMQQQPAFAFNLAKIKKAQVSRLHTTDERIQFENVFVEKYLSALISWNGQKGPEDAQSEQARNEILAMVSPIAEEATNSAIERLQQMVTDAEVAAQELRNVYRELVAPHAELMQEEGEPMMADKNPKGIVKFNLSDHILHNKMASPIIKEAADHFGHYYLLYGPSEKRICPKLRGKGGGYSGTGDVVSEYICRHHCLDGIVIDDNKTICGEALWRANAMDKQSREYVDADGNITGGYIEKRFEVNHLVPEETKMRLKPGEIRKPRPASQGNLEARMQDMRNKEGQARDYRPDTNTGQPFNWTKDVDQNNVEVPQAERDRREEAMGHKTVQYTNKAEQENNPKKAFNLKNHKTAQRDPYIDSPRPRPGSHDEYLQDATINRMEREKTKCDKCGHKSCRCGTGEIGDPEFKDKKSFNLKQHKTAEGAAIPTPKEGRPFDELLPTERKIRHQEKSLKKKDAQLDNPPQYDAQGTDVARDGFANWAIRDVVQIITDPQIQTQLAILPPESTLGEVWPNLDIQTQQIISYALEQAGAAGQQAYDQPDGQIGGEGTGSNFDSFAENKFNLKEFKQAKGEAKPFEYEGEHFKYNPFAICNRSTKGKNTVGKEKWERCVQKVKAKDPERREASQPRDRGFQETYMKELLDRQGKPGKPIGMPTVDTKKKR